MRALSNDFLDELMDNSKQFHELLEIVRSDDTLDLELRGDNCTIYYRGGKLLSFAEGKKKLNGIDKNYVKRSAAPMEAEWVNIREYIAWGKQEINYYVQNGKNHLGEKEIQQMIVHENNYSPFANDTDFFIVDMEYQDGSDRRFDLVALQWNSNSTARRKGSARLYVIEVKQGFGTVRSVSGSGLKKHLDDFKNFAHDTTAFRKDMIKVFQQKFELGLFRGVDNLKNKILHLNVDDTIGFACIMANYKPASKELINELKEIDECQFFTSSLMGYGLYSKFLVGKEKVIKMLGNED
ncbi:MAG: hypothetical protein IJ183_00225 [Prevotella sp.]|nr:hypothetical protein [Prevotella sp.]